MCGIVGAVGDIDIRKFIIDGLYSLDYRGYDSAGAVFVIDKENFATYKTVGKVELLDKDVPSTISSTLGIGHTRWATHGAPSLENCHPHFSMNKKFALVHNGVIENYRSLKKKLIDRGYKFYGDTDSEVIANVIDYNYKKYGDVLEAIRVSIEQLEGSFALAILHKGDKEKLFFAKRSSPLLIGLNGTAQFLASDAVPMVKYSSQFIDLKDDEYGYITKENSYIYRDGELLTRKYRKQNCDLLHKDLAGYPNFMIKEIEETPIVLKRLIDNYFDGQKFLFNKKMLEAIRKCDSVIFLACGTSYHASLMGVKYMQYLGKISEAYVASEWAYFPIFPNKKPIYILISQSGETADLIKCQKILNDRGLINIAITNTKNSTIERNATFSSLLYAGLEVAVASTKAFCAQVALLAMLTGAIEERNNCIEHLRLTIDSLKQIIENKGRIEMIASSIENSSTIFYIGRGNDYVASLEAALKMKEITYLHCEAFPGGELKHGPIAVVDDETSLIAFDSNSFIDLAIRNNVKEIEARGAKSYIIVDNSLFKDGDAFYINNLFEYLSTIPMVFVSQYLAYYVALHKGVNIDKPRNLAKSVTVE